MSPQKNMKNLNPFETLKIEPVPDVHITRH